MIDRDRELWDRCNEFVTDMVSELDESFRLGGRVFRLFGQKKARLNFNRQIMEFSGTEDDLRINLRPRNWPEQLEQTGFAIIVSGLNSTCGGRHPLTNLQVMASVPTAFVIFRFNLHTGKSVCMEYLPLMTPRFLFDRAQEFTRATFGQHMEFDIYG